MEKHVLEAVIKSLQDEVKRHKELIAELEIEVMKMKYASQTFYYRPNTIDTNEIKITGPTALEAGP